jgi:hypothetical protein
MDRRNNEILIFLQSKMCTFAQIPANLRRQRTCLGSVSFDQSKEAQKIKGKSEKYPVTLHVHIYKNILYMCVCLHVM